MRILPIHVIPIFLGQTAGRPIGAQVRFFDAFYRLPPVVGFDVIGCEPPSSPVTGFVVMGRDPLPAVQGFYVDSEVVQETGIMGFEVEATTQDEGVAGFEVFEDEPYEGIAGFEVNEDEPKCGVVGFTAKEDDE
jgi:hypothetical protein